MKVSIVIPVYNVENYIKECIDSVISQYYRDIEIILVNDGSTDNSVEICKEYSLKYSFIKLIHKKNGGLSDARNVGIHNSTGEYIIFLDSDDYWSHANFLLGLVQYINKNPNLDFIFFKYKFYYQKQKIYIEPIFDIDEKKVLGKSGIECLEYILDKMKHFQWFAWAVIVRRQFIIDNDLFFIKDRTYEDMLWTPHSFIKAQSVGFFNNLAYVYRLEREGQITSEVSYKNLKDNIFVSTWWFELLGKYNIGESLKKKLFVNINLRYFYAIKLAGFLKLKERKLIIGILKENKNLLLYSNGKNKLIMFLCNTIGFVLTIKLLYFAIKLKKRINSFLSKRR